MAVDIFGHSANMDRLIEIASKFNLKIISDTAQAPASYYHDRMSGTIADVGGYSLNYHKHIHTGEGGILVTNDEKIAKKLQLIRNHAEAVVGSMNDVNLVNMIGYNFRLGEIECAIGIEQLKKLKCLVEKRQKIANLLNNRLDGLDGLILPTIEENCTHSFYVYPMILEVDKLNLSRDLIIKALKHEGIDGLMSGYVNVHMLPIFQNKIAFGSKGFPWNSEICHRDVSYKHGICPVAEKLHEETFFLLPMCLYDLEDEDVIMITNAFEKVWKNLSSLKNL